MKTTSITLLSLALLALTVSCRKETDKLSNKEKIATDCPRVANLEEQTSEPLYNVTTFDGGKTDVAYGTLCGVRFYYPGGLTIGADDNLYITDTGNDYILMVKGNKVTHFAGGLGGGYDWGYEDGPRGMGKLSSPFNTAVDQAGNLYVTDAGGASIRKIDTAGTISTIITRGVSNQNKGYKNGPLRDSKLFMATALAVQKNGDILFADHNLIRKISFSDSTVSAYAGREPVGEVKQVGYLDGPKGQALFGSIDYLRLGGDGTLYIVDKGNKKIRKLSPDGIVSTVANLEADLLGVSAEGDIYASFDSKIFKIDPISGSFHVIAGSVRGIKNGVGEEAKFLHILNLLPHKNYLYVSEFGYSGGEAMAGIKRVKIK